jgi:predicted nucleotidyltransferase
MDCPPAPSVEVADRLELRREQVRAPTADQFDRLGQPAFVPLGCLVPGRPVRRVHRGHVVALGVGRGPDEGGIVRVARIHHRSLGIDEIEREYRAFLESAAADSNVVGVVLSGSRGAGAFVTDRSDFDVFVVAREPDDRWAFVYGSPVEIVAMTPATFETYALPGSRDAWNRPAFLFAKVEIDRLDGEIARTVERKRRLTADEAKTIAAKSLDDYINSLFRSLRNLEAGRELEGRLDAAETIPPLLTTTFALEGRVRPFNKWLRYDLDREALAIDGLLERIDRIRRDADPAVQRALFRDMEHRARARGQGAVVDGWEPNVPWLRGEGTE